MIYIYFIYFLWILSEWLNDNESRGFPRILAMNRETLVSFNAFFNFCFYTEHRSKPFTQDPLVAKNFKSCVPVLASRTAFGPLKI
jgi:hypothetical protein